MYLLNFLCMVKFSFCLFSVALARMKEAPGTVRRGF